MQIVNFLKNIFSALMDEESGQDGIEYLLVVGGVSVAIIFAIVAFPGLIGGLVTATCGAINTVINPDMACA